MLNEPNNQLLVVLGPTAVGKTQIAVQLANRLNGEIISADSRQVYRNMDIGSGKDLGEYQVDGKQIPYHLIDILDAGEAYDVFHFQKDFYKILSSILKRDNLPILCGGTGMYLEAALSKTQFLEVPVDEKLRLEIKSSSAEELQEKLKGLNQKLHNTTDLMERDRLIRAIEIATYQKSHQAQPSPLKSYRLFGIHMEREALRERIKIRLDRRLEQGMIEEVESLLNTGIDAERLFYYGLEYRYLAQYLMGETDYDQMYISLLQAIRRFAKKQMSWYRRMERKGEKIEWFDAEEGAEELSKKIKIAYERATV